MERDRGAWFTQALRNNADSDVSPRGGARRHGRRRGDPGAGGRRRRSAGLGHFGPDAPQDRRSRESGNPWALHSESSQGRWIPA